MAETEIHVSQIFPSTTAYQIIGVNSGATGDVYLTLAGTSNEVIVTPSGTTITLSTPQNIAITSSVAFQQITVGSTTLGGIIFNDTEGTPKSVTVEAPTTLTSSYTLKWPLVQASGTQYLANDGSGNLSWNTVSATPAGSSGDIQFNNGGIFGADNTNLFWDATNFRLGLLTNTPSDTLSIHSTIAGVGGITLDTPAASTGTIVGGSIILSSGIASGAATTNTGGSLTLTSGANTVSVGGTHSTNGGTLTLTSGNSAKQANGGSIILTSGTGTLTTGGSITLTSGVGSSTSTGGNITLTSATPANGGSIVLFGSASSGSSPSIPGNGNIWAHNVNAALINASGPSASTFFNVDIDSSSVLSVFAIDTNGETLQIGQAGLGTAISLWGNIALETQTPILFWDSTSANNVQIQAPTTLTSTYNLFWPLLQGAASTVLTNDGSGNLSWVSSGSGVSSITGTTNQITASASTGSVTLSIPSTFIAPGSIAATSTLSGTVGTLTAATNQLVLGTTRTLTITSPEPASSSRTITLPDPGGDDSVVYLALAQTLTNKTLTSPVINTGISGTAVIGTANGGTGTSSAGTQYGVPYYSTTTTLASTAAGTAGYVLTANSGSAPTFQAVSGSGTVNSGTATNLAYYATSSTAVSTTAAFYVANSNANGCIVGTIAGDNATAGSVGEFVTSFVQNGAGGSAQWIDETSISLTKGDWDVWICNENRNNNATQSGVAYIGVSTTSGNNVPPGGEGNDYLASTPPLAASTGIISSTLLFRFNLSSASTVYYKTYRTYTGSVQTYGTISARRRR